jgi:hypothetical protein
MAIEVAAGAPTLLLRKDAFERAGLTRAALDERFGLTSEEFRVERDLVAIGPIYGADELVAFVEELERQGLVYFDDFFELSGNWPEWLRLYAASAGASTS